MANGNPLDPRAPIPEPVALPFTGVAIHFGERATSGPADLEAASPFRSRQPLRRPKEPLPVATAVDEDLILNPAEGAAEPAPAAPPVPLPASPPPAVTFSGGVDTGVTIPPDTMGVVGERFLFHPLNDDIRIQDRTGTVLSQMSLNRFWDVFPLPMQAFDPRAAYDPFGRRFLFTSCANAESPASSLLIAVSETDDPGGNWIVGFLPVDRTLQGDVWIDFPSIGFTADKITVQANLYTIAGNAFAGSSIYVWDKNVFYTAPAAPPVKLFMLPRKQGGTQVPALTYDSQESTQFLVSRWTGNDPNRGAGAYFVYEITGSVSAGTVALSPAGFVHTPGTTWASFSPANFAPQLGTAEKINAGDDRMQSVVFRHGALWFCNTVFLPTGGPARSAAQWLEVETGTWRIRQLGRVEDPGGHEFFAFPNLAVSADRDVLLGFSCFSASHFASGAYALHANGDPAGSTRAPHIYAPGSNPYFKPGPDGKNRWGDYSRTQVDPVDDRSFWTIQEHAGASPNLWATRWARVT